MRTVLLGFGGRRSNGPVLSRLCDELMGKEAFVEGDPLDRSAVYRVRMTQLLGLMGLYGLLLHRQFQLGLGGSAKKQLHFAQSLCDKLGDKLWLWGEYAIPQFLAWNFFRKTYDATMATDYIYRWTHRGDLQARIAEGDETALANPYYESEMILPHLFGLATDPLDDSFSGHSHFLEGLVHLFARSNFKREMKRFVPRYYPDILPFFPSRRTVAILPLP